MPANLRKPGRIEDTTPANLDRGERLDLFVSQQLAPYRLNVSLIAYDSKSKKWVAWFDKTPASPPPPSPDTSPDCTPPLAQADISIGPRA